MAAIIPPNKYFFSAGRLALLLYLSTSKFRSSIYSARSFYNFDTLINHAFSTKCQLQTSYYLDSKPNLPGSMMGILNALVSSFAPILYVPLLSLLSLCLKAYYPILLYLIPLLQSCSLSIDIIHRSNTLHPPYSNFRRFFPRYTLDNA